MVLYSLENTIHLIKKYCRFDSNEIKAILITSIVIGFIASFREWGIGQFEASTGVANWLIAFVLVLIAMFIRCFVQKYAGISIGYQVKFHYWLIGLVFGVILTFISAGYYFFYSPGHIKLVFLKIHRLGRYRYALNYNTMGWIAFTGPLTNILLAIVAKCFMLGPGAHPIAYKFMIINIWLAIFAMLPIPPLDGNKFFFGSKYLYIFGLAGVVAIAIFLKYFHPIAALIWGIIVGVIILVLYFVFVDKEF